MLVYNMIRSLIAVYVSIYYDGATSGNAYSVDTDCGSWSQKFKIFRVLLICF